MLKLILHGCYYTEVNKYMCIWFCGYFGLTYSMHVK